MTKPPNRENPYQGTKVIVLGASGFIGRWVALMLCKRGARLALVVRDQAAAEKIFFRYGIRGDIFELDLRDQRNVRSFFQQIKPSITFNLAGYGVDPVERENDEQTAYQINAAVPQALGQTLSECHNREWQGQDIVHVGSVFEYGAIGGNLAEESTPNPTTMYGRSKLAGTQLFSRFCQTRRLKGVTARLFTVYGPGEHAGRLLPSLLQAAQTGQPLSLTAGEQKRDFTYVEDVAEGLLRLGSVVTKPGEVVNLATGQLTPVRRFAEIAAKVLHIPEGQLTFGALPARAGEMTHSAVTITRLQQLTAWKPPTQIVNGIRKTAEFMNLHNGSR